MEDLRTQEAPEEPQENSNVEAQAAPTLPRLEDKIVEALKTCYDPEIPVDIYELGLIYGIKVGPEGEVDIDMTLTSPACPAAGSLPPEVERKVADLDGVKTAKVNVVWDPVWTPEKMTEAARLQLGMF
jgi:FeS assembly SUF system protein